MLFDLHYEEPKPQKTAPDKIIKNSLIVFLMIGRRRHENNNSLTLKADTGNSRSLQRTVKGSCRGTANCQSNQYKNQIELLALGKEPSTKLATFADQILAIITQSTTFESNELFKLEALMQTFDKQDFTEQKGFLKAVCT